MQREQWSTFSDIYYYDLQYRGTWQFKSWNVQMICSFREESESGWVIMYYYSLLFFLVWIQLKGKTMMMMTKLAYHLDQGDRWDQAFFPSCPVDSRNTIHLRTRVGLHRLSSRSRRLIFLLTQNALTLLSGLKARRTSSAQAWSNIPRLVQHLCSQMFDTRILRLQEKDFSPAIRLSTIVNGRFTLSLIPWRRLAYLFTTSIASASLRVSIL